MGDPTREGNFRAERVPQGGRERAAGVRKGQLGQRKGSKTMALRSSARLGLVPLGPKQQPTQLAFFVLIELEGSQGSLHDCKSGRCK